MTAFMVSFLNNNIYCRQIMKKINFKSILMLGFTLLALTSCSEIDDEINNILFGRVFSPVGLEAKSIGETSATLDWTSSQGASSYIVEIYADDSLTFSGTPAQTIEVSGSDATCKISDLVYDTPYSARVMAKDSTDTDRDSKWSEVYFRTSTQSLLNDPNTSVTNIEDKAVKLSWKESAGTDVTTITATAADGTVVTYNITDADKTAFSAKVTGLTPGTTYSFQLLNGKKIRGKASAKTIDLTGAILALYPGKYTIPGEGVTAGSAIINKTITIKSVYESAKAVINGRFEMNDGAGLNLTDVIMDGTGTSGDQAFNYKTAGVTYAPLMIENCEIENYTKGIYYISVASTVQKIALNKCLVHHIECTGGDMLDNRKGYLQELSLTSSTFYNSCAGRDFIRMDDASATFPNNTTKIAVDHCTIDGIANSSANRLLYVRFLSNTISWTNNIVTNTAGMWSNQSKTSIPTFLNNLYFNFAGGKNVVEAGTPGNLFTDNAGAWISTSPYANPGTSNFKLNDDYKGKGYGDPRWN